MYQFYFNARYQLKVILFIEGYMMLLLFCLQAKKLRVQAPWLYYLVEWVGRRGVCVLYCVIDPDPLLLSSG